MKILFVDIETAPNKGYFWGLFDQNISHDQVEESSYILCWSAKWYGKPKLYGASAEHKSAVEVLKPIHKLLDQADIVIHFNGTKFDIPILNREFVKHLFLPPSPYRQIDLFRVVKRAFRFESNKLAYITRALGLKGKLGHEGFQLWVDCMNGVVRAWRTMTAYNRNDVVILEPLYDRLRPWITKHPTMLAEKEGLSCPKCGASEIHSRGTMISAVRVYNRYQCQRCGGWFRSNIGQKYQGKEYGVNIAS